MPLTSCLAPTSPEEERILSTRPAYYQD
jgi:hypothetical protein